MHRTWRLLLTVYCCLFAGITSANDELVVADAIWTDAVKPDRSISRRFSNDAIIPAQPIFLWTRLEGRADALELLRQEGRLPIRHEWSYWYDGERLSGDDVPYLDPLVAADDTAEKIPLELFRSNLLEQLGIELDARGLFDWRTWSGKENVRPGTLVVRIVDAQGRELKCKTATGPKQCPRRVIRIGRGVPR